MICPDCAEELSKPRKHNIRFTSSYYCKRCKAEHIVWEDVMPGDYVIQNRDWRFYCNVEHNGCHIQRMYMEIESDTSICYRWTTVLSLHSIPQNLDESNVEEKLKLYLLFS